MTVDAQRFDDAAFRAGLAAGDVLVQCCVDCGRHRFPPLPACPFCGATDAAVVTASGTGTVYSFVRVHRSPSGGFDDQTPYTVATVQLDEGARMFARIEPEPVTIGTRVRAVVVPTDAGPELRFTPLEAAS